jgi:hypothetical protein
MAVGATTLTLYTHVAATVTVVTDTPSARPAAFATTPAMAAPKAVPSWAPRGSKMRYDLPPPGGPQPWSSCTARPQFS